MSLKIKLFLYEFIEIGFIAFSSIFCFMFATFCDVVCKCTSYSWFDNDVQLGKADLSGMRIQNHAHRGFHNFVLDRICLRFDLYKRAFKPWWHIHVSQYEKHIFQNQIDFNVYNYVDLGICFIVKYTYRNIHNDCTINK